MPAFPLEILLSFHDLVSRVNSMIASVANGLVINFAELSFDRQFCPTSLPIKM